MIRGFGKMDSHHFAERGHHQRFRETIAETGFPGKPKTSFFPLVPK